MLCPFGVFRRGPRLLYCIVPPRAPFISTFLLVVFHLHFQAKRAIKSLESKLTNAEEDVGEYMRECDKVQQNYEQLQAEGKKLYTLFLQRGELAQKLGQHLTQARTTLGHVLEKAKGNEQVHGRMVRENATLRQRNVALGREVEEAADLADEDHRMEMSHMLIQARAMELEMAEAEETIEGLEQQLAALGQATPSTDQALLLLQSSSLMLVQEAQESQARAERKSAALTAQISTLLVSTAIGSATAERELECQLDEATTKVQELVQLLVGSTTEECKLECQLDEAATKVQELEQLLAASRYECVALANQLTDQMASSAVSAATAELELEFKLDDTNDVIDRLEGELVAARQQLAAAPVPSPNRERRQKAAFRALADELAESRVELTESRIELAEVRLAEFRIESRDSLHDQLAGQMARSALAAGQAAVIHVASETAINMLETQLVFEKMERSQLSERLTDWHQAQAIQRHRFTGVEADLACALATSERDVRAAQGRLIELRIGQLVSFSVTSAVRECVDAALAIRSTPMLPGDLCFDTPDRRDSIESWGTWSDESLISKRLSMAEAPCAARSYVLPMVLIEDNTPKARARRTPATPVQPVMLPMVVIEDNTPGARPSRAPATPVQPVLLPMVVIEDNTPRARPSRAPATPVQPVMLPMVVIEDNTPRARPRAPVRTASSGTNTNTASPLAMHKITCSPMPQPVAPAVHEMACSPMPQPVIAESYDMSCSPMPGAPVAEAGTMTVSPLSNFHALAENEDPDTLRFQIDSLTMSTELLREDLASKTAELEQHVASASQLNATINKLSTDLCEARAELDESRPQLEELQSSQAAAAAQKMEDDGIIEGLHDQVSSASAELDAANTELDDLKFQLETMAPSEDLIHEVEESREILGQLRESSSAAESDWSHKLGQQLAVNKNLQSDMAMIYAKSKREIKALEEKYRHDDYKGRYNVVNQKLMRMAGQLNHLEACKLDVEATSALQEACAARIKTAHASLEGRIAEFHRQKAGWLSEQEESKFAWATLSVSAKAAMESNSAENVGLRSKVAELEDRAAGLAEEAAFIAAENAGLIEAATELEAKLAEEATFMATENAGLTEAVTELEAKLNTATFEQDSLRNEVAGVSELRDQNVRLAEAVAELEQQLAAVPEPSELMELQQLEAALTKQEEFAVELTVQLEEKARQYTELSTFVEEERLVRTEIIDDLEKDLEAAQVSIAPLQEALAERDAALLAEQAHVQAVEAEANATIAELKQAIEDQATEVQAAAKERLEASTANADAWAAQMQSQLDAAQIMMEQLGGELCEKELTLHEATEAKNDAEKALAAVVATKGTEEELAKVQEKFKHFRAIAETKIATYKENLAKSEAEVAYLDKELAQYIA